MVPFVSFYFSFLMLVSNIATRWLVHLLLYSIRKNELSKHRSKYMTSIFQHMRAN